MPNFSVNSRFAETFPYKFASFEFSTPLFEIVNSLSFINKMSFRGDMDINDPFLENYADINLSQTDFRKEWNCCLNMQHYDMKELDYMCRWIRAEIRSCAGGMRCGNTGHGSEKKFSWQLYPHLMRKINEILAECPTAAGLITINKKESAVSVGFDEDFGERNEIKIIH